MKVQRFDLSTIEPPAITSQGYLKADAIATRAGIFLYRMGDGSIRRELRHPDDVFNPDSMRSLGGIPVTEDHPREPLDAKNTKKYAVGYTADGVTRDGDYLRTRVTVTDQGSIDQVITGQKKELSCGYLTDVLMETGDYMGEPYDARQTNIVYNHLALVTQGRAGPEARVKLDAADAVMEPKEDGQQKISTQEKKNLLTSEASVESPLSSNTQKGDSPMAKVKIDNAEYEVSDTVASLVSAKLQKLDETEKALADAKKESEKLAGKADGLEATLKQKDAELEKVKKDSVPSRDELIAMGKARADLEEMGKKVLGNESKVDSMSDLEIKKAVVEKALNTKLDGKEENYIGGMFDSVKLAVTSNGQKNDAFEKVLVATAQSGGRSIVEDAKARQRQRALTAYKGPEANQQKGA